MSTQARTRLFTRLPTALVAALLIVGFATVVAHGSSHPWDSANAAKAKKKKRHALDVDYKTSQIDVIAEGEGSSDVEFGDEAKLAGKPFGAFKAHLDEQRFLRWTVPGQVPRMDYSATVQIGFKAAIRGKVKSQDGTFRGFWNYSQDSEGNIVNPITGVITSGTGKFKGAGGRFDVLDLHNTSNDPVRQAGRWTGFIRY